MARTKTFANGELLSASDVNEHLAHQVPDDGDPYDTGWITGNYTASFNNYGGTTDNRPTYRRIGHMVEIRGIASPANSGVADDVDATTGATLFTLPSGFRPSIQRTSIQQGSFEARWCLNISPAGVVMANRYAGTVAPGTTTWLTFAFMFFVD